MNEKNECFVIFLTVFITKKSSGQDEHMQIINRWEQKHDKELKVSRTQSSVRCCDWEGGLETGERLIVLVSFYDVLCCVFFNFALEKKIKKITKTFRICLVCFCSISLRGRWRTSAPSESLQRFRWAPVFQKLIPSSQCFKFESAFGADPNNKVRCNVLYIYINTHILFKAELCWEWSWF